MFNPRIATASVTAIAQRMALKFCDHVDDVEEEGEDGEHTHELQDAVRRRLALDDDGQRAHTRSTRFDPNSPCGRK